jgi:hypothetical protein
MDELASHSTLARIMIVTIERHECLTVGGEEESRCDVGVIQGGIPHGGHALNPVAQNKSAINLSVIN